jgi:N-acetylglucosamine kinase-like BadF-type ATPase
VGYYLGIDTGASKSHALIASGCGEAIGFGKGGPGNWEAVGWEGTRTVLNEIITQATAQAGIRRADITAAGFGLAGYDWPEDLPGHEAIIRELLPSGLPCTLVNDALIGLWAGTDTGCGVVVAAGTSCNCYGRNARGEIGRMIGSSVFGEYAGASELVWWATQAVANAWSLRGPATRLTPALTSAAGATDVADLLAGLMRGRYTLGPDAALQVFAVAAAGDPVAQELLHRAGEELGSLAVGVIRQLGLGGLSFDVILSGSFYKGSPLVEEQMAGTIHAVAPGARLSRLQAPPVVGAVLLAMDQAGINPATVRQALLRSTLLAKHAVRA